MHWQHHHCLITATICLRFSSAHTWSRRCHAIGVHATLHKQIFFEYLFHNDARSNGLWISHLGLVLDSLVGEMRRPVPVFLHVLCGNPISNNRLTSVCAYWTYATLQANMLIKRQHTAHCLFNLSFFNRLYNTTTMTPNNKIPSTALQPVTLQQNNCHRKINIHNLLALLIAVMQEFTY